MVYGKKEFLKEQEDWMMVASLLLDKKLKLQGKSHAEAIVMGLRNFQHVTLCAMAIDLVSKSRFKDCSSWGPDSVKKLLEEKPMNLVS